MVLKTLTQAFLDALNGGSTVSITSVQAGSGIYTDGEDLTAMTALKAPEAASTTLDKITDPDAATYAVKTRFDFVTNPAVFTCTEIGVFGKIGTSETEVLLAIDAVAVASPYFVANFNIIADVEFVIQVSTDQKPQITVEYPEWLVEASESQAGVVKLATDEEIAAGTGNNAVSASKLGVVITAVNGSIADLRNEVQSAMTTLNLEIDTIQSASATLNLELDSVQSAVATLNTELDTKLSEVFIDSTLTGKGTANEPLGVVSGSSGFENLEVEKTLTVGNPTPYVPDGYIGIGTKAELESFRDRVNTGEVSLNGFLTADIDLEGSESNQWTLIGTTYDRYTGTFDGNDKTISGLYINNDQADSQGLFGYVDGSTIKNLKILNPTVTGKSNVGGVVGSNNNGTVENVKVIGGTITGEFHIGGVVGINIGTIATCGNTSIVSGTDYVGGVVGGNVGGSSKVTAVYNTGAVSGASVVGGIAGVNNGTVTAVYNTGEVSGVNYVGGVVGQDNDGIVTSSYYISNTDIGSIVGVIRLTSIQALNDVVDTMNTAIGGTATHYTKGVNTATDLPYFKVETISYINTEKLLVDGEDILNKITANTNAANNAQSTADTANATANYVSGQLTSRVFSSGQIPGLDVSKITSGVLPTYRGGTGRTDGAMPIPTTANTTGQIISVYTADTGVYTVPSGTWLVMSCFTSGYNYIAGQGVRFNGGDIDVNGGFLAYGGNTLAARGGGGRVFASIMRIY